jgi:hypothetical protein
LIKSSRSGVKPQIIENRLSLRPPAEKHRPHLLRVRQNSKGGTDQLTVVHAHDPEIDKAKACHLRGPFIVSSYETNLIKARRVYEG